MNKPPGAWDPETRPDWGSFQPDLHLKEAYGEYSEAWPRILRLQNHLATSEEPELIEDLDVLRLAIGNARDFLDRLLSREKELT